MNQLLARKIDALQQAVRLAVIPVELLIQSDNMTEVAVYHVGRLGKFQQKQLTLQARPIHSNRAVPGLP